VGFEDGSNRPDIALVLNAVAHRYKPLGVIKPISNPVEEPNDRLRPLRCSGRKRSLGFTAI
jgi:hypothetical protein